MSFVVYIIYKNDREDEEVVFEFSILNGIFWVSIKTYVVKILKKTQEVEQHQVFVFHVWMVK